MAENDEKRETTRSVEAMLANLRRQSREIEQAIYAGEAFLASLRGMPDAANGELPRRRRLKGKTNAMVLTELLLKAEPTGLLVRELVQALQSEGHRLAMASDPIKATSNELAGLRRRGLVYKDPKTGKYRVKGTR